MKWSLLHVLCVVLTVSAKFLIPDRQINKNLVSAVVEVIQNFFSLRYGTVNIITAVEERNLKFSQSVLDAIVSRGDDKAIFCMDNYRNSTGKIKSRFRKYNVILLDTIGSFKIFNEKLNASLFMSYGYFLFVLIDGKQIEHNEIFSTFWAKSIYNVNLMYDGGEIETFMPFSYDKKCGDTEPVLINSFINGTFKNGINSVFPDKFKDLHNCSVKFVTFNDTFAVSQRKLNDGSFKLVGYDIDLMEALARSIKFHTHLTFLEGREPWGNIYVYSSLHSESTQTISSKGIVYPNGTVTNALKEIYKGNVEVGIGNYYLRANRLTVLESSITYYSFPIVFVIPPGK